MIWFQMDMRDSRYTHNRLLLLSKTYLLRCWCKRLRGAFFPLPVLEVLTEDFPAPEPCDFAPFLAPAFDFQSPETWLSVLWRDSCRLLVFLVDVLTSCATFVNFSEMCFTRLSKAPSSYAFSF